MMDVKEDQTPTTGKFQTELRLYLEVVGDPGPRPAEGAEPPDDEGWPPLSSEQILLFLKYYDAEAESLSFVGTHIAQTTDTLTDLLPTLRAAKGLDATQVIQNLKLMK